jgi:hypothetical protein
VIIRPSDLHENPPLLRDVCSITYSLKIPSLYIDIAIFLRLPAAPRTKLKKKKKKEY